MIKYGLIVLGLGIVVAGSYGALEASRDYVDCKPVVGVALDQRCEVVVDEAADHACIKACDLGDKTKSDIIPDCECN